MENLPAELLQQIAWFSLNPEFYLVSKKINSKLTPLYQFEIDIAALLFCDRVTPRSAWVDVDPFPWQTSEAATSDYKFSLEKRQELQQVILTQSWFSPKKFHDVVTCLCKLWMDRQWILADMSAENRSALQDYLESGVFTGAGTFYDNHGNMLWAYGYSEMGIYERGSFDVSSKTVVEVLCYPLKLFVGSRSPSKLRFFHLLWSFMPRHQVDRPAHDVSHPHAALRKALSSVVVDGDEDWFDALFPLAMSSGVGIPVHQLVHEVTTAVLSRRKWKLMKQICQGIRLPLNYLESCLAPAVAQAISDGDTRAHDFQQWIGGEEWATIQRFAVYPEW
jgi:hypothetical protein